MSHSITIQMPESLHQQISRAASLLRKPPETIILESLNHTLPPILDEIPAFYQRDVAPLLSMDEVELRKEAGKTFPQERWEEYERLLEKKKTGKITIEEEKFLDALRREADLLTFRRAYASVLLKRRGYPIPHFPGVGSV